MSPLFYLPLFSLKDTKKDKAKADKGSHKYLY